MEASLEDEAGALRCVSGIAVSNVSGTSMENGASRRKCLKNTMSNCAGKT